MQSELDMQLVISVLIRMVSGFSLVVLLGSVAFLLWLRPNRWAMYTIFVYHPEVTPDAKWCVLMSVAITFTVLTIAVQLCR